MGRGWVCWEWLSTMIEIFTNGEPPCVNLPHWVVLEIMRVEGVYSLKKFAAGRVSWIPLGACPSHKISWSGTKSSSDVASKAHEDFNDSHKAEAPSRPLPKNRESLRGGETRALWLWDPAEQSRWFHLDRHDYSCQKQDMQHGGSVALENNVNLPTTNFIEPLLSLIQRMIKRKAGRSTCPQTESPTQV